MNFMQIRPDYSSLPELQRGVTRWIWRSWLAARWQGFKTWLWLGRSDACDRQSTASYVCSRKGVMGGAWHYDAPFLCIVWQGEQLCSLHLHAACTGWRSVVENRRTIRNLASIIRSRLHWEQTGIWSTVKECNAQAEPGTSWCGYVAWNRWIPFIKP